jgi:ribonuclease HI
MSDSIRVFFDGSCNEKYKSAAFIVKRNDEVIHQQRTNIDVPSSVYAEYKALEMSLMWTNKHFKDSSQQIDIYGDCKPVIMCVTKYRFLDRSKEFELLMDVHRSCRFEYDNLRKQHDANLLWIPRTENHEVDDISRPETERRGWRYSVIKEINQMLINYAKMMNLRDIQNTVKSFLSHYTGVTTYRHMSSEQLTYVRERLKELECMTVM